eukprot:scaffold11754_cov94-Skeletonema_dohrnii-CCMP3373.AAC.2
MNSAARSSAISDYRTRPLKGRWGGWIGWSDGEGSESESVGSGCRNSSEYTFPSSLLLLFTDMEVALISYRQLAN